MTSIAIYIEGGGQGNSGRAMLRQGFETFLRHETRRPFGHAVFHPRPSPPTISRLNRHLRAVLRRKLLAPIKREAIRRAWRWRLICWGGRDATYRRFRSAIRNREADVVMLVVDAESPLNNAPIDHLRRQDGWDLSFVNASMIHLMVQTMETWLVADPDALAAYYGQGFRRSALPTHVDIESVPKSDVERAVNNATRDTQKGDYHKIRHASELLKRVDPDRVQDRCPACAKLFAAFDAIFDPAD